MEQDVFCQIIAGGIPTTRLYEDKEILAFADINPQAPIHILIVPKKHLASLNDLSEEDQGLLGHMVLVAQMLAREHGLSSKGYRLALNCGQHGGQVIPHLHLHLLGGRELAGAMC